MHVLRYFFNSACFAVAFGMTLVWLYTYLQNEDSVRIDLKRFNFPKGQYPMLSFCLIDPFIQSEIKRYKKNLTVKEYKAHLMGIRFRKEMNDINFDNVTRNLADFYNATIIKFRNGSQLHRFYELPQVTYIGFRDRPASNKIFKCFGLKSNFTNIEWIRFRFNSRLYPGGIRPSSKPPFMLIAVHLPNQISLTGSFTKERWPERNKKKGHLMRFMMQQLEVLNRRNKRNDPCVPDELDFDGIILEQYLEEIGCKPPYHRTDKSLKVCDSEEKMKETSEDLIGKEKPRKACTSATTLTFTYDEIDNNRNEFFDVQLSYPHKLKEVVMVRAVDLQTVIGNADGYIGLFLGIMI